MMTFKNLDSINHYLNTKGQGRLSGSPEVRSNQMPLAAGAEFRDILSAFQTQPAKNTFKTKGLTIVDYRARPVISKSRLRPQLKPAATELKNTVSNQFPEHRPSPAVQNDALKSRLPCTGEIKAVGPVEKYEVKTDPQGADRTEHQIIGHTVRKAAEKYNLPPELINAVIRAESNFEVQAVSSAGAQGLMQLMPATAKELGVINPFDIEQNIDGGARYLRKMLDRFGGSVRKALAAYNAGPGTVSKYGGRVPYPETRQYVQRVLRFSSQMA
jgi:soluble lytic murein transglycosylase-like protein